MYNKIAIGNALFLPLQALGETITLHKCTYNLSDEKHTTLPPKIYTLKASLLPATKAAYNMEDRELLLAGYMEVPLEEKTPHVLRGCYFYRSVNHGATYLLLSLIIQANSRGKMAYVYAVQCNELIEMQEYTITKDAMDNEVKVWKTVAVFEAYFNTVLRTEKQTQDGSFDQAIYTCIMPARYKASKGTRVIATTFNNGKIAKGIYKVESITTSLVNIDSMITQTDMNNSCLPENGEITGVINTQLSYEGIL